MELSVHNMHGKPVGTRTLSEGLWGGPVHTAILSQAIQLYRTNLRAGLASSKTRGDVSGGGKKPWRQKHTGRARAGSSRSPLWRHGGVIFGPHPRPFRIAGSKALRRRALLESLKGKLRDQECLLLEPLTAQQPKTKPFAHLAATFGVSRTSLIVLDEPSEALVKSLRNLAAFEWCEADTLNAYDVLRAQKVLLTEGAFERVERRVSSQPRQKLEAGSWKLEGTDAGTH